MIEIEVNKEMIINDACKVYEKYSAINSKIYYEYGKYKYKTVKKFFDSFVVLIQEVNKRMLNENVIIKEDISKFEIRKEYVINKVLEYWNNGERYITQSEFLEFYKNDKEITIAKIKRSFGTFTNLLKEAEVFEQNNNLLKDKLSKNHNTSTKNSKAKCSKEEIDKIILDFFKNKEKISSGDLYKNSDLSQCTIKKFYGSFGNMKKELFPDQVKEISKENLIKEIFKIYELNGNKINREMVANYNPYYVGRIVIEFGSFTNMLKELGFEVNMNRFISKQELIDDIKSIIEKHNTLNYMLFEKYGKYSIPTYIYRIGTLDEILNMFNISNNGYSSVSESALYLAVEISNILKCNYELEKKFDWLVSSTSGFSYRIDCYFEKYKLAIEYDGAQHYEIDGFFNKNQKDLKIRQERDNEKNKLCKENNLKLIRFREEDIENTKTIEKKLKEYNII